MQHRRLVLAGTAFVALGATLAIGRSALDASVRAQTVQAAMFEVDPAWPKPLPNRWILGSSVGVAVDAQDHVYVLNLTTSFNQRTEIGAATTPPTSECCTPAPSILEFDQEGNLVKSWGGPGQGYDWPSTPQRIAVDPKGNVWIGGSGGTDSHILKFGPDGKLLLQISKPATAAPPAAAPAADAGGGRVAGGAGAGGGAAGRRGGGGGRAGGGPAAPPNSASMESFGGPAKISFDVRANEAYVADGYRNRRVAVIDMETGKIKRIFGAYANTPSDSALPPYNPDAPLPRQFGTPVHCAEPSTDGFVYVCDRSNDRIQVFRTNGTFVKEQRIAPRTLGGGSVWDIAFSRDAAQRFLYVADGRNMKVHVLDRQSLELLTSFGDGGRYPGQFLAVNSLATDSRGNLFTVETAEGKRVQKFTFKGIGAVPRNQGVLWPKR